MFHPVLEGAVHFSEASFCLPVVHPALDGVVQISDVSFCLPVRALLFSPVDRLLCMVAMSSWMVMTLRPVLVGLMLVRVFVVLLCLPAQAEDR